MKKLILNLTLVLLSSYTLADQWSNPSTITKLEPHTEYQGGVFRVVTDSTINPNNCSVTQIYDFMFDTGTIETRSAVISGLYMAFASNKKVRFYVDSNSCSPAGSPIIRGIIVL